MAKQIAFDQHVRDAMRRGVAKLARAVSVTLGPRGRNVVLDKSWGGPRITKDGVSVAEDVELSDPYENLGVKLVKEAASKTGDVAGDGTTTATVLADALVREGFRNVTAGVNPMHMVKGIRAAVAAVLDRLRETSRTISSPREVLQVATIAANNDKEIGKTIAQAMDKVGNDGVITIEEGKGLQTEVEVVEGMHFDRGFLSHHFVTDQDRMEVVLEKPIILILEEKLSSVTKLVSFLEKAVQARRPLLIIAEDVEGEALATLVVNKVRGILECVAVKAPGYGERRKAMLQDLAVVTGGKAFFKDLGEDLESIDVATLGTARKVQITSERTLIIQGGGGHDRIQERIDQIRRELESTDSDYDREKLQERLAKLGGGIAVIRVGAVSETELKERKARFEDALNATRAAAEEGVVAGGGAALLRASVGLTGKGTPDEVVGWDVVRKALSAPISQIADNAGYEGAVVAHRVLAEKNPRFGWDAERNEYGDMFEAGVIDPTKVTRNALQNASSVACLLLTTDCAVANLKDAEEKAPAPAPAMGGF